MQRSCGPERQSLQQDTVVLLVQVLLLVLMVRVLQMLLAMVEVMRLFISRLLEI
jgi:hypothetical protein